MSARALISIVMALELICMCSAEAASSFRPVERTVDVDEMKPRKMETEDGFYVEVPGGNGTEMLLSFGVDPGKAEEGRGKQKKLLQRILPMFIMPFLIQSAIIPMFLGMLKFMLFKAAMVGKLALALIIFNAFKNHNSYKGRAKEDIAVVHYGYHGNGMEEYGAYIN